MSSSAGNDPATDLRSVGMLALLQLLSFVSNYRDLSHRIYLLSKDETQNFPFAIVGVNMTAVVLQSLREVRDIIVLLKVIVLRLTGLLPSDASE
jgi:hypothetical protein